MRMTERLERLEQRAEAGRGSAGDEIDLMTDPSPYVCRMRWHLRQLCHRQRENPELDARYGPLEPAPAPSDEGRESVQTISPELHDELLRLTTLEPDGRPRHEGAPA